MFKFIPSKNMKIEILENQKHQISSKEKIKQNCEKENVFAFDIYKEDSLIGFAMFRKSKDNIFLWNYAIDKKWQDKHYGEKALVELLDFLKTSKNCHNFITTYKIGNDKAKHIYEKIGFVETETIIDGDIKEVNMELKL